MQRKMDKILKEKKSEDKNIDKERKEKIKKDTGKEIEEINIEMKEIKKENEETDVEMKEIKKENDVEIKEDKKENEEIKLKDEKDIKEENTETREEIRNRRRKYREKKRNRGEIYYGNVPKFGEIKIRGELVELPKIDIKEEDRKYRAKIGHIKHDLLNEKIDDYIKRKEEEISDIMNKYNNIEDFHKKNIEYIIRLDSIFSKIINSRLLEKKYDNEINELINKIKNNMDGNIKNEIDNENIIMIDDNKSKQDNNKESTEFINKLKQNNKIKSKENFFIDKNNHIISDMLNEKLNKRKEQENLNIINAFKQYSPYIIQYLSERYNIKDPDLNSLYSIYKDNYNENPQQIGEIYIKYINEAFDQRKNDLIELYNKNIYNENNEDDEIPEINLDILYNVFKQKAHLSNLDIINEYVKLYNNINDKFKIINNKLGILDDFKHNLFDFIIKNYEMDNNDIIERYKDYMLNRANKIQDEIKNKYNITINKKHIMGLFRDILDKSDSEIADKVYNEIQERYRNRYNSIVKSETNRSHKYFQKSIDNDELYKTYLKFLESPNIILNEDIIWIYNHNMLGNKLENSRNLNSDEYKIVDEIFRSKEFSFDTKCDLLNVFYNNEYKDLLKKINLKQDFNTIIQKLMEAVLYDINDTINNIRNEKEYITRKKDIDEIYYDKKKSHDEKKTEINKILAKILPVINNRRWHKKM